jgi:hypothetical protein
MNIDHAATTTTVAFSAAQNDDEIMIGGKEAGTAQRARVIAPIDRVRSLPKSETRACVFWRGQVKTFPISFLH